MTDFTLGLTVALATAMSASPGLAQMQELAEIGSTEPAEVATVIKQTKLLPLQPTSTPTAEAMPAVEFSVKDLLEHPKANSPLSTDLAPLQVTQNPVTVVNSIIEPAHPKSPNPSSVEAVESTPRIEDMGLSPSSRPKTTKLQLKGASNQTEQI